MKWSPLLLPGGLRTAAIFIAGIVLLSFALDLLKAQSIAAGLLAERLLYGLGAVAALVNFVKVVGQYRRCERGHAASVRTAQSKCYFAAALVLIVPLAFVRSVAPLWWVTPAGRISEACAAIVGFVLLMLGTRPARPSSSGQAPS